MTTFYDWLYLGQTQYDPDDLNKREKELAKLAWEEAQPTIPEGWQLVPKEPDYIMKAAARNASIPAVLLDSISARADLENTTRYKSMLEVAPKFGEKE